MASILRTRSRLLLMRFGRMSPPTKHLRINENTKLPVPQTKFEVREYAPSRLADHYHTTLADNLMYMTYIHPTAANSRPKREIRTKFDAENPYSRFRHNPPVGGNQFGRKPAPPSTPENTIRLEKIVVHTMVREAIANRSNLLPAIMALRAITGESFEGGGKHGVQGVQIVRGRKSVGGWIRKGIPVGAKVELRGDGMYAFINTLVEFVLPRLRDFNGFVMPAQNANKMNPSSASGVVTFGLTPQAVASFPQVDVNVDSYPSVPGFNMHFVTSAIGAGAQNKATALLSGFQILFIRR